MTDHHIHIGQFNQIYYDPIEVFEAIESTYDETLVSEIYYSSTSSCRDDVELFRIEEEIDYAQNFFSKKLICKPYLWFVPKYAEQNISIESATQSFDYCGIKLHPFAQKWDMKNPVHRKAMEQIFEWSSLTQKSILIHCGPDSSCLPNKFEYFFKTFPKSKPILAHSNPVDMAVEMLKKYPNVKCDTAYMSKKNLQKLFTQVIDDRILFGSDFPVTHYFENYLFEKNRNLKDEYVFDYKNKIEYFFNKTVDVPNFLSEFPS